MKDQVKIFSIFLNIFLIIFIILLLLSYRDLNKIYQSKIIEMQKTIKLKYSKHSVINENITSDFEKVKFDLKSSNSHARRKCFDN